MIFTEYFGVFSRSRRFIHRANLETPELKTCMVKPTSASGKIAGEQPKGLAQLFVSKVVSQTPVESIKTYQAQALSTGAVVVRVD